MRVQIGSNFYFFIIFLMIITTFFVIRILKNQSEKRRYWIIFAISLSAFILHFIKILFPPYTTESYPLRYSTFENICAVSTLLFPWIYLSKGKWVKDYMIMIGIISGIASFVYPVVVMVDKPYFEVFRFYYAHYIIFLVPFLMHHFKMHQVDVKRLLTIPLLFSATLFIIYMNELILAKLGWIDRNKLYDVNGRNPSLIFGIHEQFSGVSVLFLIFTPKFLRFNPFSSTPSFFPVLWLVIPIFIYITGFALILYYILEREETRRYMKKIFSRHKTEH